MKKITPPLKKAKKVVPVDKAGASFPIVGIGSSAGGLEALSQYTGLYDFAPVGYFTLGQNGDIQKVNLNGALALGIERAALIKRHFAQYVTDESRSIFNAFLKKVYASHKKETCEVILLKKDHDPFWAQLEAVCAEDSETLQLVLVDISERKKSEQLYHAMFEKTHAIKLLIDPIDGAIVDANSAAANVYGYSVEQLKNMKISEINILSDAQIQAEMADAVTEKRPYFNFCHRLSDGEIRDVEVYSSPLEIGGRTLLYSIIHDISERKRAEESLRVSLVKYKTLFECFPLGITVTDNTGSILETNSIAEKLLDVPQEEHIQRDIDSPQWQIVRPDGTPMPPDEFASVRALKENRTVANVEAGIIRKDATCTWINVTATPLLLEGYGVVITYGDITERKIAEEHLEKFKQIVASTSEGISLLDTTYRYVIVNKAYETFSGKRKEELIGVTVAEYLGEAVFYEHIKPQFDKCLNGETIRYQNWFEYPTLGNRFVEVTYYPYIDARGEISGVIANTRDITERKQAEDALRESEEKYRQIVETAGEGVWIIDAEGNTTFANQKMAEMLGYSVGEMLGVSFYTFIDEDGKAIAAANVERRRQGITEQHDFKFRRKDGTDLWAILETSPILDRDGRYAGALAMITDITERKQAEEALRESEARYRTLLESTSDSVYVLDREWRHIVVNEAATRFVQMPKAKLLGSKLTDLFPGIEETAFFKTFQRVMETREPDTTVAMYTFADGKSGWYEVHVDPTSEGILCISRDITERKQAEEALQRSEYLLAEAERVGNTGSWDYEVASDTAQWSANMFRIFDVDPKMPKALVFKYFIEHIVHPDDRKHTLDVFQGALEGRCEYDLEYRIIWRDGSVRIVHALAQALRDDQRNALRMIGWVEDITERKQAEMELIQSEAKFRSIFDQSPVGSVIIGLDKHFIRCNSAFCNFLGYTESELIGKTISDITHSEDLEIGMNEMKQMVTGKIETFTGQKRYLRKDGVIVWAEISIRLVRDGNKKPLYFIPIIQNITARKRAETALGEFSQRLKLAIASGQFGVWDWNVKENVMIWDDRMFELYGVTRDVFPSNIDAWTNGLHPDDSQRAIDECNSVLNGEKEFNTTFRILQPGGAVKHLKADGIVIRDSDGKALRMISINADITERKQAEETIRNYAENLEQRVEQRTAELVRANRVKDEFLANMSHELRTPLNSILGFSETLLEGIRGPLNERQEQGLQIIYSSGEHLLGLINDILDVSKIEAGKFELQPELVSINDICHSSLNFIKQLANKKSITVEYFPAPDASSLQADPKRLKQILVNLLSNAVKFTPEKGSVSLAVQADAAQGQVSFSVKDTGIGIAPEDLPKLFQPFVQLDSSLSRNYAGTGLGLMLVQKLVGLHSGAVQVESIVGSGSCFTVILPWTEQPETKQEKNSFILDRKEEVEETIINREGIILLAEDNEDNIILIRSYLEHKGYQVFVARNGSEALAMANELAPMLILMDVQMPQMDGLEATRRLRVMPGFAAVPIIILTAFAMPEDRERCLAAGANDYLTKPVDLMLLIQTIEKFTVNPHSL